MQFEPFITIVRRAFPGLTPEMEARFAALDGLYREWNAKINVISRKDIDALYDHHVLHSLAIARYLTLRSSGANNPVFAPELQKNISSGANNPCFAPELPNPQAPGAKSPDSVPQPQDPAAPGANSPDSVPQSLDPAAPGTKPAGNVPGAGLAGAEVLDLGTGGGFPGIPLAILFPEAQFTLCDSIGKKTIVADAVARALDLRNVTVVNARAESLGKDFDYVVSRAVATLEDLYPWVRGRFRKSLLLLKGGDTLAEELSRGMARHRLQKGSVSTWPIDAWLRDDPWYTGKFVVEVRR